MTKLHELLAAEKTPTGAWNTLLEDTLKKFKNVTHFFDGHTKSLKMVEESAANAMIEDQNRESKPVTTTVYDTLEYALGVFEKAEDLQFQKNMTNQIAVGTVMWRGAALLPDMPVDQLLGLEARLGKIRGLYEAIPTLDATREWRKAENAASVHVWQATFPDETTKTDKTPVPIIMVAATDKHPAQVKEVTKDMVIGKFTMQKYSGAATAQQKADALKLIDELLVEVKQARSRANDTQVAGGKFAKKITELLLSPFKN